MCEWYWYRDFSFCYRDLIYLDNYITNKGRNEKEIERQIRMQKPVITKLSKIWRDYRFRKETRLKLFKVFICLKLPHMDWNRGLRTQRRIEAFEKF